MRHAFWGSVCGVGLWSPDALAQDSGVKKPVVPNIKTYALAMPAGEAQAPQQESELRPHSLSECLAIAMANQPSLRAAEAGLQAALAGQQALGNIHPWTTVLAPDLPVRRLQSQQGIAVASAEINKVKSEITHDVTLLYLTYVYARQQEQTAINVLEQMDVYYEIARELLKQGPSPRLNQFTLYGMEEALTEVRKLSITARIGQKQALAALHEAMGVDPNSNIVPKTQELPVMAGQVTQEQVVDLAMSRRAEVAQVSAGTEAFRLEVCAQYKNRFGRTVPTLASGSDLHARQVPMAIRNGEYKPGALSPEMPPTLVGRRDDRVARAQAYLDRQEAVVAKTLDLVRLEAINAHLAWQAASERLALAKTRFDRSLEMVKLSRDNAPNIREYDVLIRNEGLAGKAQAEYLEAVFEHIKALLRLQRVTAGGVAPAFPNE
jgi:outer membrane protein TolC